jgi:hypothetical protein
VKSIKERGIKAYPELLPPGKREHHNINDLDVIEECVGLRTTRKGGVRVETTSLGALNHGQLERIEPGSYLYQR